MLSWLEAMSAEAVGTGPAFGVRMGYGCGVTRMLEDDLA